jgi:hypothetical protein
MAALQARVKELERDNTKTQLRSVADSDEDRLNVREASP